METEIDSFPSVISASVCSGEEKSRLVRGQSWAHGGWGTQAAREEKEMR